MYYGNKLAVIDTEESAYILGFMFADGCIRSGALALQEEDKGILIQIQSWLGSMPATYVKPQMNRLSTKGQWRIFMGKERHNLIHHLGNKKDTLPNLPTHLMHHFVRGIFDGDGCVSIDNRYVSKYPNKAVPGDFYILFNEKNHAEIILNTIVANTAINVTRIVPKTGLGSAVIYKIRWGGTTNLIKIREWLYKDATIYLRRKKEKFDLVRFGDRKEAAASGGKSNALRCKTNYINWSCQNCGQSKITKPSQVRTYCSRSCANSRSKK
jgi:hypothetical protein